MIRAARLADPALAPLAAAIARATGWRLRAPWLPRFATGEVLLCGLGAAAFAAARHKALARRASLVLVFPGPLPQTAAPFPAALGLIELSPDRLRDSDSLAAALRAGLADGAASTQGGEAARLLAQWRAAPPDPWYRLDPLDPQQAGLSGAVVAAQRVIGPDVPIPPEAGQTVLAPAPDGGYRIVTAGTGIDAGAGGNPLPLLRGAASLVADDETLALYARLCGWPVVAPPGSLAALIDGDGVAASVLSVLRWLDPYDGAPMAARDALDTAALLAKSWADNDRPSFCIGSQTWNHAAIRATFTGCGGSVTFCDGPEAAPTALAAAQAAGGRILSWAGKTPPELEIACAAAGVPLLRIEDGFLRSVGLGAGLARGASLAADDLGIYYDPSRPSRLEVLLETRELTADERARAAALGRAIVAARLSKYNFGRSRTHAFPADRAVVLVPGQVADDAAVRRSQSATIACASTDNVNLDLLRLARVRHPDAFLVYKPHPDVETGLRKGRIADADLAGLADHVARDANIIDLIEASDRLETFSSLSGFEALLRGKPVTVHGLPFYAGWGLSDDLTPCPRRTRRRSLDELVYLALVVYTRTIDPVSLLPCRPEYLVGRLMRQRASRWHRLRTAVLRHASWLGRRLGI
ncbi:capsular polysaccharide biosynthesis protein [Polymorphum gilvum]|uniref:Capsule polysaccharide biosynthesis n=1 Tax=Polymorphum gilvum (strain LMG 25793 / CGMCC 1.9160 / SL003B-26A1) TaxID=991905 RepID=F2J5V8_POLGS|nr:capsular polysaccharide biosynthesis protein [Polymorphum gilvum]ADZ71212.1 Capsule polysaccharide biosynthesis [Polymorphum gilvum SL003B-26A1]